MSELRDNILRALALPGAKWTEQLPSIEEMRLQYAILLSQAASAQRAGELYQEWLQAEGQIAQKGMELADEGTKNDVRAIYSHNRALQEAWGLDAPVSLQLPAGGGSKQQRRVPPSPAVAGGGAFSSSSSQTDDPFSSTVSDVRRQQLQGGQKEQGSDDDDTRRRKLPGGTSMTVEIPEKLTEAHTDAKLAGRFAATQKKSDGSKYETFDDWYNAYTTTKAHERWYTAVIRGSNPPGVSATTPGREWREAARDAFDAERRKQSGGQVQGSQAQITAAQTEGEFEFPEPEPAITEDLDSDDDDFEPDF